jgi:AcrR family transcriptional regulator
VSKKVELGRVTRQGLVETARKLFAEGGYEATSIEAVAAASGVSRGALYHHFTGKEALFEAVLEAMEAEIAAEVIRRTRRITDPVEALRAGCQAWLHLASDPAVRRIALQDAPSALGWARWRSIDERHGLGLLKAAVAGAAAAGRLRSDLVDVTAHVLLAAVMEVALLAAYADNSRLAARQGQAAIDVLLTGLFPAS